MSILTLWIISLNKIQYVCYIPWFILYLSQNWDMPVLLRNLNGLVPCNVALAPILLNIAWPYTGTNLSWLQSTDFHTLHVYNSFIVDFVSCQIYMCIHCNFCIWHIDYNFKCIIFFNIWTWIIFMNLIFPKNWFPFYHMLVYLWNIYTNNKLYTWKMWYPRYMYFYIFFTPTPGTCIFIFFSPQPQVHVFD